MNGPGFPLVQGPSVQDPVNFAPSCPELSPLNGSSRPSSSGGAYVTDYLSQVTQEEAPFPGPLFNPRADENAEEEAHLRSRPPHPWPARMFRTWWWVCKCDNTHCVEMNPMIVHMVAVGAAGCFNTKDGEHDLIRRCSCWHTFVFGKDRNMIHRALSDAMIPQSVFYSLIPVWGYAGSPGDMRLDHGTLIFKKKCSVFPHHRVLMSNWLEIPDMAEAAFLTWRHNTKWMRQAATMRRIMSEAARSEGLIAEGQSLSKVLMTPMISRYAEDRDVDTSSFWEDSLYLGGVPPTQ